MYKVFGINNAAAGHQASVMHLAYIYGSATATKIFISWSFDLPHFNLELLSYEVDQLPERLALI